METQEEQHSLKYLPTVARFQGKKRGIQLPRVCDLGRLCPESFSALQPSPGHEAPQPGLHTRLSPAHPAAEPVLRAGEGLLCTQQHFSPPKDTYFGPVPSPPRHD